MTSDKQQTTAKPRKAAAEKATHAHTNLNTFGAVVALLEGGLLYGGDCHTAAQRIIKICQTEQQRQLRKLDAAMEELDAR